MRFWELMFLHHDKTTGIQDIKRQIKAYHCYRQNKNLGGNDSPRFGE